MKLDVKIGHPKVDVKIPQGGLHVDVKTPRIDTPPYTGDYTVTPSTESQTLETNGLRMTDDVTVEPMPQGSLLTQEVDVTANAPISVSMTGVITSTVNTTKQLNLEVGSGYIGSLPPVTVNITGGGRTSLSTFNGQTITPTEEQQTLYTLHKYGLGNIVVSAIPSDYAKITQSGNALTTTIDGVEYTLIPS